MSTVLGTREVEPLADFCEETAIRMGMRHGDMMMSYYSVTLIDSKRIDTLATNGLTMWINRGFYMAMSREQRMTAMAHELWHKMLLHVIRIGTRDPGDWNEAGDHVINIILTKSGYAPLVNIKVPGWSHPFNWICDMKYDGMTTEQVYDAIRKEREKNGGQPGQGQPGGPAQPGQQGQGGGQGAPSSRDIVPFGRDPDGSRVDKEGKPTGKPEGKSDQQVAQEFVQKVRDEIEAAAAMSRMAGKGTSAFDEALGEMNHVKVPWYEYMEEYFISQTIAEFSYARFDRRQLLMTGMLAPDIWTPAMGGILYAVDCSGSVSNDNLALINRHQKDIIKAARPAWLEVAYFCDAIICTERFEKGEYEIDLRRKGSGGTSFAPVMEHALQMDEPPALIMVMTDLYGDDSEVDPGIPVMWVCVSDKTKALFGTVINVE